MRSPHTSLRRCRRPCRSAGIWRKRAAKAPGPGNIASRRDMPMYERLAPEQYDSLTDIPEPVENPHLFGHEDALRLVAAAYRSGKMHHALMVTGPRGIGKATFAFHLAHYLFRHPDPLAAPEMPGIDTESQAFRLAVRGAHP